MIRKATIDDLEQLKDIYNEAVLNTVATFDLEVKDYDDRRKWFEEHQKSPYILLVEEVDGKVAGYASLSKYRERPAFDASVEISVYIDKAFRNQGIGKGLMKEVLKYAYENDSVHTIVSLITGENEQSIYLHKQLGFEFCGIIKEAGYKFDRWLDLAVYQIIK